MSSPRARCRSHPAARPYRGTSAIASCAARPRGASPCVRPASRERIDEQRNVRRARNPRSRSPHPATDSSTHDRIVRPPRTAHARAPPAPERRNAPAAHDRHARAHHRRGVRHDAHDRGPAGRSDSSRAVGDAGGYGDDDRVRRGVVGEFRNHGIDDLRLHGDKHDLGTGDRIVAVCDRARCPCAREDSPTRLRGLRDDDGIRARACPTRRARRRWPRPSGRHR